MSQALCLTLNPNPCGQVGCHKKKGMQASPCELTMIPNLGASNLRRPPYDTNTFQSLVQGPQKKGVIVASPRNFTTQTLRLETANLTPWTLNPPYVTHKVLNNPM